MISYTPRAFIAAARAGKLARDAVVRAALPTVVKVEPGEGRELVFIASTGAIDHQGDTIKVSGWTWRAAGVPLLWAHNATELPIGRSTRIERTATELRVTAQFAPPDLSPIAEQVLAFYRAKFLSDVSVGFRPLKWSFPSDRPTSIDFEQQILLELSCVPVGANPQAVVLPPAAGGKSSRPRLEDARRWLARARVRH